MESAPVFTIEMGADPPELDALIVEACVVSEIPFPALARILAAATVPVSEPAAVRLALPPGAWIPVVPSTVPASRFPALENAKPVIELLRPATVPTAFGSVSVTESACA